MPVPPISPLPPAPQITDAPGVFNEKANAFVAALSGFGQQINVVGNTVNTALTGATFVQFDGFKGEWEQGSYDAGEVVFVGARFFISLVDSNTEEPPGTGWQEISTRPGAYFAKTNRDSVAWEKTGNDTAKVGQTIFVEVSGQVLQIAADTPINMPTLVAGTDYAIWIAPDGTVEADDSFNVAPTGGGRRVGGFHYAPGGNAPLDPNGNWSNHDGGNTTPQINEYSFYDLKWKPAAPDPRGLTLVSNSFWVGIYHLVRDHLNGAPHRNNAAIAKGGQNPQNPYGTGAQFYDDSNWWNIGEALAFHGFSHLTAQEFQLAAIGVKEEASRGNDPVTTGIATTNTGTQNGDEKFTSHWGCIQMTGVVQPWSAEIRVDDGEQDTSGLQGRGDQSRFGRAARLGIDWDGGSASGSRASISDAPWGSGSNIGGRGRCDHLILD